jgi:pantetheine-phosphate adenylyltransferase
MDIALRAARIFDVVIVGVFKTPKKNLLFDIDERYEMVRESLKGQHNIQVAKFSGFTVDYAKEVGATVIVRGLRVFSDFEAEFRMGLANKKLAPEIETVAIMTDEKHVYLSSSTIREIAEYGGDVSSMTPALVAERLTRRFAELRANHNSPGYMYSIRD